MNGREIREHYRRITEAVEPLGAVAGNPTMLVNDKVGWYITRANDDPADDEVGQYEKQRRARRFPIDYETVVENHVDRTLYALSSYKRPQAFERWEPATFNSENGQYDYKHEKPTPQTEDLVAISAWGDMDLADDLKAQRPSLDADTYAVAEAAYDAYIDAFADLYGGRDAVYMLDSVGGAYMFGAPEATLPIARHFSDDEQARARVFDAFIERSNEYLEAAEERINDEIEQASDVVHPDWANNLNRQYKMPLSLHGDHDCVVTPVDVEDVQYREPVGIDAVDDDLLDDVREWCESFTAVEYDRRVASIVATLWPDEFEQCEDWQTALEMWVDAERERERATKRRREKARQRREERRNELGDGIEGASITPFITDIYDAIDDLDIEAVADRTIVHQWTDSVSGKRDNSGDNKRAFIPTWRTSSNGTACYIDEKGSWNDGKENAYGTVIEAALIKKNNRSETAGTAEGADWWEGVDALRELGFEVPVWLPEAGSQRHDGDEYEKMPLWALRKAAVALDVFPSDAFVEKETDDGETYLDFPGQQSRATALEAVEDAGFEHGWEVTTRAGGAEADETDENSDPSGLWERARRMYEESGRGAGRYDAADALEAQTSWMYVLEEERLWVYNSETGRFSKWGKAYAGNVLEAQLGTQYSKNEKKQIIERLEVRNQVHRSELNSHDGYYLCVGNGVVDLETGDLHDHDPSYKFTRGVEWDYDPDKADTGTILEFLDDITKRKVDRDTLIDHLAHGLMPGHPYQAFVMMFGPGANGKTIFGNVIRGFVGADNAANVELQDLVGDDDFATGALPGSFVNIGDDNSVREIKDASTLKTVTGHGGMRANSKNEKRFDFKNEAAMFFSANEPPHIAEQASAIGNRLYPIEMPYEFKNEDEIDPENPMHKPVDTRIAERLTEDADAMRGLLCLCVEHAQRLLATDSYSMPEGPTERRARYEAASDPVQRFALNYFEAGEADALVLKDDAFDVYKLMCEMQDERVESANAFKQQITQQSIVDAENTRTRQLTPGEGQEKCWRYAQFSDEAKEIMPDRLVSRYFSGEESDEGAANDERTREGETSGEMAVFGAEPISSAAEALTGYVTVTAEVVTARRLGEDENGVKAVLKDARGAIDAVAWDADFADRLEAAEGSYIALKNAEVGEYEGDRQLSPVEGLTELVEIQAGVGYTEGADAGANQQVEAAADGGTQMADTDEATDTTDRDDTESETTDADDETTLVDMHGMSSAEKERLEKIDRTTQFGNQFKLERDGGEHTLEESMKNYREWFADKIETDDEFRAAVEDLRGETLGCWCVDSKDACHGEVIIDYLHGDEADTEAADGGETGSETDLDDLCPRGLMFVRDNHGDRSKGVPQHELVDYLKDHGATESQTQHVIEKLLSRGEISEPAFNHYRA
jgi:putative DNA primase/helicase